MTDTPYERNAAFRQWLVFSALLAGATLMAAEKQASPGSRSTDQAKTTGQPQTSNQVKTTGQATTGAQVKTTGHADSSNQAKPSGQAKPGNQAETGAEQAAQDAPATLREGTKLANCDGGFRDTGDRVEFRVGDSDQRLVALENLALERVAGILAETRGELAWSVSGVVTEYRGVNYLLITRAVLKSKRPAPSNAP
jgi:hypothetical protein